MSIEVWSAARRCFLLAAAAVVSLPMLFSPAHAAVPAAEKNWLTLLFSSTGGESWARHDNWPGGDPCDNHWYGLTCDAEGAHVAVIHLPDNHLTGILPAGLNGLMQLQGLVVRNNRLSGPIPALPANLRLFHVHNNRLSGPLPAAPTALIAGDSRFCQAGDGNAIGWSGAAAANAAWQNATLARYSIDNCQGSTAVAAPGDAARARPKMVTQPVVRKRQQAATPRQSGVVDLR
jgi:hypothetical protein